MLRATSETAAAMTVRSPEEKPSVEASRRLSWRAVTLSTSARIAIRCSARTAFPPLPALSEVGQAFLEVEGGCHPGQGEAELHHREGHLGLNAHDDGLGSAQHDHLGEGAQRADRERVHHVEHRHVNDDAPGPVTADLLNQVVPEAEQVGVGERSLDRRDQVIALLENWYQHRG